MAVTFEHESASDVSSSEQEEGDKKSLIKRQRRNKNSYQEERQWWFVFLSVTLLSLVSRQISLDKPAGTIWDEVHFGTFTNHYINRTFYHDVHPPLGKMLIAGAAWLTGYNATFDFQMGKVYSPDFDYVSVRAMVAVVGACLVPISFLVVWELSFSLSAASIAAVCVLSDTFLHRLNTVIVLDPVLLTAILASVYGTFKFHNQRHREWSKPWWLWLMYTGVCLGAVMSIKYVGAFTVLFVGLHTLYQLACIAGNPRRPIWHVFPHTLARALGLIALPIAFYLSTFVVHFWILTKWSVNGGGFYPTKFFAAFDNTEYDNVTFPENIHYGANITIQSSRSICGYLESWYDLFPSELTAPCQQVTTSTMRDDEALTWIIKKVDVEAGVVVDGMDPNEKPVLVRSGDHILLTHAATGRSLRSHGHRAPITKRQFQVCGYGDDGAGGPYETWKLIIPDAEDGTPLTIIDQDFMLKHWRMNCFLKANEKVKLPKEWAFNGAKEVTCTKNQNYEGLLWHINWNNSPKLNATRRAREKTVGLLGKIYQQHLNMFIGNAVLTGSQEDRNSRPWMWPILWQIQTMGSYSLNKTSGEEEYAIGMTNPFVTYLNLLSLSAVLLLAIFHSYQQRRTLDQHLHHLHSCHRDREGTLECCWWLLLCWAIHYLPFFFMSRILYYHHYCPSYLFSCMITGLIVSWMCQAVAGWAREEWRQVLLWGLLSLPVASLLVSYMAFFPLATHLKGYLFEPNPDMNQYLDYFYAGQMWPEFGYRKNEFEFQSSTLVETWIPDTLDNPDVNVTLYYKTMLNNTQGQSNIRPVHSSNFSQWQPGTIDHEDIPYIYGPQGGYRTYDTHGMLVTSAEGMGI